MSLQIQQKPQQQQQQLSKRTLKALMSENAVYCLPKRRSNIVDIVLKIMEEDGPRPMKNLKPVQKTRTGADLFYLEHDAEYEARGKQSCDDVERVQTHNRAYPKMYDELNRRRSTAQPEAYHNTHNTANDNNLLPPKNFNPNCRNLCIKLKRKAALDRAKQRRSSHYGTREGESSSRELKTKIKKCKRSKRNKSPTGVFKLSKIWINKGCQCNCYYLPAETKSVATFNDDLLSVPLSEVKPSAAMVPHIEKSYECYEVNNTNYPKPADPASNSKKPSKSDIDSGNPETNSAPSVSTYNSYMSMEHEPMVE